MTRYAKIVCLNGPRAGVEYTLDGKIITIGRAVDADITLEDHFASRQHAEIRRVDNAYQVHDLGSKNGILVNGRRLAAGATAWLDDGTEMQFASTHFRFQDPSATLTAPSVLAVKEPGLRVDPLTRQVYADGQLVDPPLSRSYVVLTR